MRDHYEVLGIEEDAENSQIKKAYRKLALKYHPDKNQGNEEAVTKLFREVQNAYDVLMDPQERAWYDKHKDAILMKSGEYEDNEVSISEFFSPFCYTGFEDDDTGFYSVYRQLFKDISEEDYKFMNADEDDYPQFGDSKTDPVFVVQVFYGYWQSYSTKKTYVWEEEYDTRDAPNRWVRRKMEQENNKVTDQHRKDRSKSVQALVDFVRRRDPRIKEYRRVLEEKQKLNDEKAKRKREEKLLEDLVKAAQYEKDNAERLEEERRQLEALERELGFDSETESLYSDDSQTLDVTNENLEDLSETEKQKIREEMLRDEELIQNIQAAKDKRNMSKKQKKKQRQMESTKHSDTAMTNSPKQSKTLSKKQKKKLKKQGFAVQEDQSADEISDEVELVISNEEVEMDDPDIYVPKMSKKQKKKLKKQGFIIHKSESESDADSDNSKELSTKIGDLEINDKPESRLEADLTETTANDEPESTNMTEEPHHAPTEEQPKKLTAKEKRRLREKQRQEEAAKKKQEIKKYELDCKICKDEFDSRNSLFKHIKETGHAELKGGKGSKKNKKK